MPNLSSQFVICPKCNGRGRINDKLICNECGGIGLGTFIKNDFLYWGYDLTPQKIIVRQSRRIFDAIVLTLLTATGAGGFVSLLLWLGANAVAPNGQMYLGQLLTFWREQDAKILFFWAGLLCLLFAYVRLRRAQERFRPVKLLKYWQWQKLQKQVQRVPNNWRELRSLRTNFDVAQSFDKVLLTILEQACVLAVVHGHREILPAHVLDVLLEPPAKLRKNKHSRAVTEFFTRLDIYHGKIVPKLKSAMESLEKTLPETYGTPVVSLELKKALIEGYVAARSNGHQRVVGQDVIAPLLIYGQLLQRLCDEFSLTPARIEHTVAWLNAAEIAARKKLRRYRRQRQRLYKRMQRATNAVATPLLNHFCTDITDAIRAGRLGVHIERPAALEKIFTAVSEGNRQLILAGERGSGRYETIEALAERIVNDDVPAALRNKKILVLDVDKLTAEGGEMPLEKKFLVVINEALIAGDIILTIRDISEELWRAAAQAQKLFFFTTATEKFSPALAGCIIEVAQPNQDELFLILAAQAIAFEEEYTVLFNYEALATAARAAGERQEGESVLNGAIEILKTTAQQAAATAEKKISAPTVAKAISQKTGVPYTKILKAV